MKKFLTLLGVFLVGSLTSLSIVYAIFYVHKDFPDVNYNDYYGNALKTMQALNIISGYSNGNFGPNDPVTRAQLVTILHRYGKSLFNLNNNGYGSEIIMLLCLSIDKETLGTGYPQETYEKHCNTNVMM